MTIYKHILVGLDLSNGESQAIAKKALEIAKGYNAKIDFTHVIEPLTFAYTADIPINLEEIQNTLTEHAKENMAKLVKNLSDDAGTLEINHSVTIGQTAHELHSIASDISADLIIVGSHGRHGLSLIFGSTSTGVLHGAKCDVLAIKV